MLGAALVLIAVAPPVLWFWWRYLRLRVVPLADDVFAVLGAGGNSLVVRSNEGLMLVDPKFGVGARGLRSWLRRNAAGRVILIVNTHYHYDHTQGNALYPGAQIAAHPDTPRFMLSETNDFNDPTWWRRHQAALPDRAVDPAGETLTFGKQEVAISDPGIAHTHADLFVHLPGINVVVTGDLCFNGYYPFFNGSPAGCSISGMTQALRDIAGQHPTATFVPGHGPLAKAADLLAYADYLELLESRVTQALREQVDEDESVRRINVSRRGYTWLPSVLGTHLLIATAQNNVRWAYRILAAKKDLEP